MPPVTPPPFASAPVPHPRTPAPGTDPLAALLPAPVAAQATGGPDFHLGPETVIVAGVGAEAVAGHLADLLRPATGYPLPVVAGGPEPAGGLRLTLAAAGTGDRADGPGSGPEPEPGPELGPGLADPAGLAGLAGLAEPEGYRLDATATGVRIRAATAAGLHHGVQTLRQLLPVAIESADPGPTPEPWTVPAGWVVDHPRYPYRGAMLDVARRFFPVPEVLRFIDHLTRYKINHLHLHLTDDQGWRIAIDSWPRLTEVGGATAVAGGPGGWYSAAEYRRIVEYAAARHITVVPEIDLPGHTNAALTAYGQLAPDGVAPPPYTGEDVGFSALAVDRELTYRFVDEVLGEVAALTPGPYLHIGGDEAFTLAPAAYTAFMDRVQEIVAGKGKTVVGWHQLAVARPVPGRILQYWGTSRTDETVAAAVRQGARLILSPGNHTYLDMKYDAGTGLGKDWAGLIEVDAAYGWDPGSHLDGVPAEAVLGVEAPLWTETVRSLADAEYLTFPRLAAVAEVGWSAPSVTDRAGFRRRLAAQGARWRAARIAFHRSPGVPWPAEPQRSVSRS